MNIVVTHSSSFDYVNELYLPLRNSKLNSEHTITLPHETGTMILTKPLIENKKVDIVIAEVSYPSTGQGIELGWADSFKIPIICIFKKGMKYSGALKTVTQTFIEYQEKDDMLTKLTKHLKQI